jgi:hypothetical protein
LVVPHANVILPDLPWVMSAKGETPMPATPESIARTRAFARIIGPFLVVVPGKLVWIADGSRRGEVMEGKATATDAILLALIANSVD